jgi:hypothetical protein
MPQPSIARIERGAVLPRTATVLAILEATGHELLVEPRTVVRPAVREAAHERLSRSVPRRVRDAVGRAAGPTSILRRLGMEAVPFVLVGDLAEAVHGGPRSMVRQIEICHPTSTYAIARLAAVLHEMSASPSVDASDLRADHEISVTTDAGGLRLVSVTAAGDDYEVLVRNASRLNIGTGLLVAVASLEDLVRVRRARREGADIEILAALESHLGAQDQR